MDVTTAETTAPGRSRQATAARLRASAVRLFAERGLHGVTSHEIARDAGVAAGTFYLHYKDKRELFREILFSSVEDLRTRVRHATAEADSVEQAVRARAEAVVGYAEQERDLVAILFRRDTEAADLEASVLRHMADGMTERLRGERDRGEFSPHLRPEVAAQALLGMTVRLLDWWCDDPRRATRDEIIETLVRLQLEGAHPRSI